MQGYTPIELDIRRARAEAEAELHDALAPGSRIAELIITADLEVSVEDGAAVFAIRFPDDDTAGAAAVEAIARALGTEAAYQNDVWIAMRDFGALRIEATFTSHARTDALLAKCRAKARDRAAAKKAAA